MGQNRTKGIGMTNEEHAQRAQDCLDLATTAVAMAEEATRCAQQHLTATLHHLALIGTTGTMPADGTNQACTNQADVIRQRLARMAAVLTEEGVNVTSLHRVTGRLVEQVAGQ
jgi:hypothetical protein